MAAVTLQYGNFIQAVVDFLIIALAIFMMIKAINLAKKKEEEAPAPPPEPTKEETLLTEIRDLLKKVILILVNEKKAALKIMVAFYIESRVVQQLTLSSLY